MCLVKNRASLISRDCNLQLLSQSTTALQYHTVTRAKQTNEIWGLPSFWISSLLGEDISEGTVIQHPLILEYVDLIPQPTQ